MYVCKYQHLLVGIFVRCYVVHNRGVRILHFKDVHMLNVDARKRASGRGKKQVISNGLMLIYIYYIF